MKVLIDGVEVKCNNDVKIIYDLEDDDKDLHPELHLTLTHEGLIGDIFLNDENEEDEVQEAFETCSHEVEDLIDCLGMS